MEDALNWTQGLVGDWKGVCRTWFEPGKLADESPIEGTIFRPFGPYFLRHTYRSTILGEARVGEETLVFNPGKNRIEVAWMDTFHSNRAILFSEGEVGERIIAVRGSYAMEPEQAPWGWRTEYVPVDARRLRITAYNVTPDGAEARAVEIDYRRDGPDPADA